MLHTVDDGLYCHKVYCVQCRIDFISVRGAFFDDVIGCLRCGMVSCDGMCNIDVRQ